MALRVDAESLWTELREAKERNEQFFGADYKDLIRKYAGEGYRKDWEYEGGDLENHAHSWISLYAPLLLSGQPRVRTRSRRLGSFEELAKGLEHALNRGIVDNDMRALNEELFYEWAFRWAVSITTPEPVPGNSEFDDAHRPVSKMVPGEHYLHDTLSLSPKEDRWRAHLYLRDKEDLIREAKENKHSGWNLELLEALDDDQNIQDTARELHNPEATVRRAEVVVAEMWVSEHTLEKAFDLEGNEFTPTPEDGYNGTIFTLAFGSQSSNPTGPSAPEDYLRRPRPCFGPVSGPYTVSGAYHVPKHPEPLSPIASVQAQSDELNLQRQVISRNMASHKKGIATTGLAGGSLEEMVKEFEDNSVFHLPNVDDSVRAMIQEIELGGINEVHLTQFQFLQDSLNRNSGIDDTLQGNIPKDATATAVATASQSTTRRSGFLVLKFVKFLEDILKKEAWYYFHDERAQVSLGPEAEADFMDATGQLVAEPVWIGGVSDDEDVSFEDIELEVDLYSVGQTSQEAERMKSQQMLELAMTIVPMMPQTSLYFDWKTWLEVEGERMGEPKFAQLFDVDSARAIGMLQLGGEGEGQDPQGQSQPQPRLVKDQTPAVQRTEGFSNQANMSAPSQNGPKKKEAA